MVTPDRQCWQKRHRQGQMRLNTKPQVLQQGIIISPINDGQTRSFHIIMHCQTA